MTEKPLFGSDDWLGKLVLLYRRGQLAYIAVDECHVTIEYPDSGFRSTYERLGELRAVMPDLPIVAVSAIPTVCAPTLSHTTCAHLSLCALV